VFHVKPSEAPRPSLPKVIHRSIVFVPIAKQATKSYLFNDMSRETRFGSVGQNKLASTIPGGRVIAPMTRARTASSEVAILAAIQPLLETVLMLFVSLVQGVRATLGMWLKIGPRD